MIDPARLARALRLTAERLSDGRYMVTGGTRPHVVDLEAPPGAVCNCEDHQYRRIACAHELRALLAVLDDKMLAALRALVGTGDTAWREIVRPGADTSGLSGRKRPSEPGLPLEAFQPPLRERRRGARRACFYQDCPKHRGAA